METVYKVGDLKRLISESSNEFKAKIGDGVESKDKENSGKAYKDASKRAKDFDGGLQKSEGEWAKGNAEYKKVDGNKTMLDVWPENADDSYKKRVKTQVKGYTSELEEDNGIEKVGDFSDNEKIYDGIKDAGEKMADNEKKFRSTGLRAREMDPSEFEKNTIYTKVNESQDGLNMRNLIDRLRSNAPKSVMQENKAIKTVYFKKTTFLNEGHMISRIPDEFKNEGSQFKMKDKTGNEYLVEWSNGNGKILAHSNKSGMNESVKRMMELSSYSTRDTQTTQSYRVNEGNDAFTDTLNKARRIIK